MKRKLDGSYSGKVTVGYKPNGKPIQKILRAKSSIEFWRLHYQLRNGIIEGTDRLRME
jgi:hypothetical protein